MGEAVVCAQTAAVVARDERSVRLQEDLLREWKRDVRKLPPADREIWLNRQETIVALGARRREDLLGWIDHLRGQLSQHVPSGTWFDDAWYRGAAFPPGGNRTRMVRARQGTRNGLPSGEAGPAY